MHDLYFYFWEYRPALGAFKFLEHPVAEAFLVEFMFAWGEHVGV